MSQHKPKHKEILNCVKLSIVLEKLSSLSSCWKQLAFIPNPSAFIVLTDDTHEKLFAITSTRTAFDQCEASLASNSCK